MLNSRKLENGLLALILVSLAALAWTPAAEAQTTTTPFSTGLPTLGGGTSFGGGMGISGGTSFTGGTTFTGSTFGGGTSGTAGTSGSNFTGGGTSLQFRGGFNGVWLGTFTGGGSYRGGSTGGTSTGGTGGTAPASAFSAYYVNPLAPGSPSLTSIPNITVPISGTTGAGGLTGGLGGGYGAGGYSGGASGYGAGGNSYGSLGTGNPNILSAGNATGSGARRTAYPYYTVSPTFDYRPAGPNVIQSQVQDVLARSSSLSPNRQIRVAVEGPAIVLRGTVASEQDRRLAEALVRLTPGVHEVLNQLEVAGNKPQPRSGP